MKKTIRISRELKEIERAWNALSKKACLWDEWEVAHAFFDPAVHEPYGILVERGGKAEGMLPLWFNKEEKWYGIFGDTYRENISFWFEPEDVEAVFEAIPEPAMIFDIRKDSAEAMMQSSAHAAQALKEQDARYFLSLERGVEGYLRSLGSKHRKNLGRDLQRLAAGGLEAAWKSEIDIEVLEYVNRERFKEESDYADPSFAKEMRRLFSLLGKKGWAQSLEVRKDEEVVGAYAGAFHKGVFCVINGGYKKEISNLGKFLVFEQIKRAEALGARTVDFLAGDTGWKTLWNFEKEAYYELRKAGDNNVI